MPDHEPPGRDPLDEAEKGVADAIERAIGTPVSAEEEAMLEAAEILEVELGGTGGG